MSINGLEITDIMIKPMEELSETVSPAVAMVRIVFNNVFVLQGIRIVIGKFGPFISFPRFYDSKQKTGYNVAFPITEALHSYMSEKILKDYNEMKAIV